MESRAKEVSRSYKKTMSGPIHPTPQLGSKRALVRTIQVASEVLGLYPVAVQTGGWYKIATHNEEP